MFEKELGACAVSTQKAFWRSFPKKNIFTKVNAPPNKSLHATARQLAFHHLSVISFRRLLAGGRRVNSSVIWHEIPRYGTTFRR
jgi:hypothetical protein